MPKAKIAVTVDAELLERLDRLVREEVFASRSEAIQAAVADKLARLARRDLAAACALLDPAVERSLAEEGLSADAASWPAF
jgi:Arc/MetJ-type ribon-helix-helix transcriptional regulator